MYNNSEKSLCPISYGCNFGYFLLLLCPFIKLTDLHCNYLFIEFAYPLFLPLPASRLFIRALCLTPSEEGILQALFS